jgi:F-type H+-transporting ATPase subunit b
LALYGLITPKQQSGFNRGRTVVSVSIDWTLIVQLATFLILMVILNQILYKPIQSIIREREGIIGGLKKRAQDAKSQLEADEAEESSSRTASLSEGARLQGVLRAEGQTEAQAILSKAQEEASSNLEVARAALRQDVEAARAELAAEAKTLAQDIAKGILGRAA